MSLLRWFSVVLLLFNGIAACFGGYALVCDPSDHRILMPLLWLTQSPFENYLIPGLILLIVIGIALIVLGMIQWRTFTPHS